jgi:hypothetical protein
VLLGFSAQSGTMRVLMIKNKLSKDFKNSQKNSKIKYINDIIKDFKRVPFFYIKLHIPYKRWKNNQKKNINVQNGDLTI